MAVRVVKVPDIGEGIAEVELVEWHVRAGEAIAEDQPLADVMTDKASVEIPSPYAGTVLALGGELGQMLAVGAELVRIEVAGDTDAAAPAAGREPPGAAAGATGPERMAAPAPRPAPAEAPLAPATPGAVRPEPAQAPSASQPAAARPIASPSVRRRAWELGLRLEDVRPSGTAGRITHADLEAHARTQALAAPARAAPALAPDTSTTAVPVIGLRRRIALRMQEAKRRIPHFSYVEEIDVTELEALRAQLNAGAGQRARLTPLPLVIRALVLAAREHPQINARFDDEAGVVTRHGAVHVGIATQTPHGLIVPVLRHAEARDPWSLAAEIARLAAVARDGRATRDELSGSTITVTSLGALGGIVTTPVINAPEVAIVGVNRIVERPAMQRGAVVPRLLMNLSSSFDHRVVDGADAAQFVQAMRRRMECPGLLFAPA